MRRSAVAALVLLGACGGTVVEVVPPRGPCQPPEFREGECVDETLNDGGGPDDHRKVCVVGRDKWVLYPSGERWWTLERDAAPTIVLCHVLADGAVQWQQDAP